ncbi:uncharacterized protein LOC112575996 isoform X1 [Pomacea canaliculata]|uniref:uncharacterized protein LOC112575996 isoform X1 n=1 Tax=Pomacea canaliculata TaxID=400727 RepID=UPI000D738664|nr:uncharacterized protein LOC112575996 isoform X1 [Pomacea canaliculata]XP_025113969.1 uncharacterized protein LOC112575996 isoform X1 [Pomacea canaliculata]XP_025113970.1 uncharacterized protein LOC112575996 isoform X1 [Pomacea canaliculata]
MKTGVVSTSTPLYSTMLKLLVLSTVAIALGQLWLPEERVSGYRVEYDDFANVVLLVSDKECYLVEAPDATWDALVRNHNELHAAALDIVKLIDSKTGVTATTFMETEYKYHSRLEALQCGTKSIAVVSYTPSASSATTRAP